MAGVAGRLMTAAGVAGFFNGFFNSFTGFARALLNPANQFVLLAFGVLEIVIREFGPFLFQLALGDVPVAFDFKCGHNGSFRFGCLWSFTADMAENVRPLLPGFGRLGHVGKSSNGV